MTKVFISYSRKDKVFAGRLTQALQQSELDTWIDWEDIPPTADWMDQIHKGIEQADAFLFLLSPDSVASKVCGQEVDHAVQNGKRLIPIVARDVNPNDVHPALAKVNWIYCRESDDFDGAVSKTLFSIRTDLAWVEMHRRLQVRAIEWERKHKENSFLLRGKDLQDAEQQLSLHAATNPQPTDLQREYALKSRQVADRQRRLVTTLSIAAAIIMLGLAIFGFNRAVEATKQRNVAQDNATVAVANEHTAQTAQADAEEKARIARARELATLALVNSAKQIDLAYLLGIEALQELRNYQTLDASLQTLQISPNLRQFLFGHSGRITSVIFSPNGKTLASMSQDNTIFLWDVTREQVVGQKLTEGGTNLIYSPDGNILAIGNLDSTITLWDISNSQPVSRPLNGYYHEISSIAFSPDSRTLAIGGCGLLVEGICSQGEVSLWDVVDGKPMGQLVDEQAGPISKVMFSDNGKTVVSLSGFRDLIGGFSVIVWDVANGQPIKQCIVENGIGYAPEGIIPSAVALSPDGNFLALEGHGSVYLWNIADRKYQKFVWHSSVEPNDVSALAFSPDGSILASGGNDKSVRIWSVDNGELIYDPLVRHNAKITSLVFNPEGTILASGSSDNSIVLWDLENGRRYPRDLYLVGHTDTVTSISFSLDGETIASGSYDKSVILWNIARSQPIGRLVTEKCESDSLVFSPDGQHFAAGCQDGIIFWDSTFSQPIYQLHSSAFSIAYSPDGKTIVSEGKNIILWDMTQSPPLPTVKLSIEINDRDIFSPDGKILASVSKSDTIILWDVENGKPIHSLVKIQNENEAIHSLAFTQHGDILATGSTDHTITLWNVSSGEIIREPIVTRSNVSSLAFSPDGQILASGEGDGTVLLWDALKGELLGELLGHNYNIYSALAVRSLVFSPDGSILASGSNDKTIILWDVVSRRPIGQPLTGHEGYINSLVFNPEGNTLVSAGRDKSIIVWSIDPQLWIEKTCLRVGRNFSRMEWRQYGFTEPYPIRQEDATCPQWPLELEATSTPMP